MIATPSGDVAVRDFHNNPKRVSMDRTSVTIQETAAYNIAYYEPDHSFNIVVTKTPFDATRAQAEATFIQDLGISRTDACKLNVKVGAPSWVDPEHAGQNFRLSYCTEAGTQPASEERVVGQLLLQAQTLFEDGQYSAALERCNALLAKYPRNMQAAELKRKIEKVTDILKQ